MSNKIVVATFDVMLPIGQENLVVLSRFSQDDQPQPLPVWLVTAMSDGPRDLRPSYQEMGKAMAAISQVIAAANVKEAYVGYQLDRMGSTTRLVVAVAQAGLVLPKNLKVVFYSTTSINFIALMHQASLFAGSHTIQQADNNQTVEEAILAAWKAGLGDAERLASTVIPAGEITEKMRADELAKIYKANPLVEPLEPTDDET